MVHMRRRRPRWLEFLGYNKERREHFVKWRTWGLSVIALFGLACIILLQGETEPQQSKNLFLESRSIGRRLLEDNTTESSHCEFEQTHIPEAWIFHHCLFIIIIFIALAIICDDFFVPSLEIISEKLNLSEDVAGATFMAAGSSAPELFTSVAAVIQGTDVGVGTIVGSAVFNLLIIIALTAALAGQILVLDWRPLMRDSFFYAMSIGCFIGFAWDGYFTHYESAILLSLYILYLVLMVFNPKILEWMGTWKVCCKTEVSPANEDDAEKAKTDSQTQLNHKGSDSHLHANGKERRPSFTGGHARRISIINRERAHSEERIFHHKRGSIAGVLICPPPKHLLGHHIVPRKDSGFQSHENSSYIASTDTSHTEIARGTPDSHFGDKLRPSYSAAMRNGYLAGRTGSPPSDEIEMTTVEHPALTKNGTVSPTQSQSEYASYRPLDRRARTKRTQSEETVPPIHEYQGADRHGHRKLQRSASEQSRPDMYYTTASVQPSLPPISPTNSNNGSESSLAELAELAQNDNEHSNPETPSGSNQTCNSAQALVSECNETPCPPNATHPDLYSPDPVLQQSGPSLKKAHLPHGDSIKEENPDAEQKEEPEEEEEEEQQEVLNICPCCPCCPKVRTHPPSAESARAEGGCWAWTKFILRWIIFIPAFPFVCLFSWTIPDCSTERLKKYYAMSFVISVCWIAGLSFAMVTLVERTGCILNIDTYIMGLVIVAIGTSIPDALSSILVARDGYGDMAVSNAIGSNVFDINLGLGLPFIIRICIDKGAPISLLEQFEWVDYFNGKMSMIPHAKFGFLLLLILFLAIIVFFGARFRLTKFIGITFVTIYFCFMAYAFTQELYCRRKLDIYC